MKTTEIFKQKKCVLSAEVFPPKKSGSLEGVIRALKEIGKLGVDFVSVTYGASGNGGMSTSDVASVALDAFGLNTAAHITCVNLTKEKLDEQLQILKRKGIENILCLRGDVTPDSRFYDFRHADELCAYISANFPAFNLLGACYPEGHYESDSLDKDIDNLKRKVDSGAKHLITQLFLDNQKFFDFSEKLESKGIWVPVEAGIMPVVSGGQIKRIVELSGASLPARFTKMVARYEGEALYEAGINYATEQIIELISSGVRGIHLYTMNRGDVFTRIYGSVKTLAEAVNNGG